MEIADQVSKLQSRRLLVRTSNDQLSIEMNDLFNARNYSLRPPINREPLLPFPSPTLTIFGPDEERSAWLDSLQHNDPSGVLKPDSGRSAYGRAPL